MAGFVDGEGCIRWSNGPRVEITNTNLRILEDMRRWFGGGISASSQSKNRKCFRLTVCGDTALDLLGCIVPYLIIKKKQGEMVLHTASLRSSGKLDQEALEDCLNTLRLEKDVAFDRRSDEECGL